MHFSNNAGAPTRAPAAMLAPYSVPASNISPADIPAGLLACMSQTVYAASVPAMLEISQCRDAQMLNIGPAPCPRMPASVPGTS